MEPSTKHSLFSGNIYKVGDGYISFFQLLVVFSIEISKWRKEMMFISSFMWLIWPNKIIKNIYCLILVYVTNFFLTNSKIHNLICTRKIELTLSSKDGQLERKTPLGQIPSRLYYYISLITKSKSDVYLLCFKVYQSHLYHISLNYV